MSHSYHGASKVLGFVVVVVVVFLWQVQIFILESGNF